MKILLQEMLCNWKRKYYFVYLYCNSGQSLFFKYKYVYIATLGLVRFGYTNWGLGEIPSPQKEKCTPFQKPNSHL
jgi:hypothetical protein